MVPIANPSHIGHHVELALLLKDKVCKPHIPIGGSANNREAEKNIVSFRKKSRVCGDSYCSEVNVDITTIDHNPADGIVLIARETLKYVVILGCPCKRGVWDILLGEKVDLIVKNMDKNLFICHMKQKLIALKRIVVISPPSAEKEDGFNLWVDKIALLSSELSVPVLHLGHPETQRVMEGYKKAGNFNFEPFTDWSNPLSSSKLIRSDDLVVMISAHSGYVSHLPIMDSITSRLESQFPDHSRIVIYPCQQLAKKLLDSKDNIFVS